MESTLWSGLVMLLTAGAVFALCLVIARLMARARERYREVYSSMSGLAVSEALLLLDLRQRRTIGATVAGLGLLLGATLFNGALGVALGLAILLATRPAFARLKARRTKAIERQLIDTLQSLSGALRVGLGFPQALEQVAREAPAPLSLELGITLKELRLGVRMEEALERLALRVESRELTLFVAATSLAQSLGGNLAEVVESIGHTLHERFRIEGRIVAMTAQGKMQGWILAILPLLFGFGFNAVRPDLMGPMLHHPFGYALIGVAVVMEGSGILLMRRIVTIEV